MSVQISRVLAVRSPLPLIEVSEIVGRFADIVVQGDRFPAEPVRSSSARIRRAGKGWYIPSELIGDYDVEALIQIVRERQEEAAQDHADLLVSLIQRADIEAGVFYDSSGPAFLAWDESSGVRIVDCEVPADLSESAHRVARSSLDEIEALYCPPIEGAIVKAGIEYSRVDAKLYSY